MNKYMSALDQFKNMPSIEKKESSREISLNKDYDEKLKTATPEKTSKMQLESFKSIYGFEKPKKEKSNIQKLPEKRDFIEYDEKES